MNRRSLLRRMGLLIAMPLLPACTSRDSVAAPDDNASAPAIVPLNKPHESWKGLVSAAAFAVLFNEDTERSGSSPFNNEKRVGTYICAACYLPMFDSAHKFESGTGWPSFTQPIAGHMGTSKDYKLVWPRTEYHCARCGGHQGHVFDDGPNPRGERWCNNGVALEFVPEGQTLPELRG